MLTCFQRERRQQRRSSRQDLLIEGELGRVQPRDIFPDAQPDKGPWHLLQEEREVLGAHRRVGELQDGFRTEQVLGYAKDTVCSSFLVDGYGVRECVVQIRVATHTLRHTAGQGFYTPRHPLAEVRVQGPDRSPEAGLLRDDVEGCTGPDLPHRQDRGLHRVYLPRHYGLQRRHYLCSDDHGVGGQVRHRAVPARTRYLHLESVGRGHDRTCLRRHLPERQPWPQVQREDRRDIVCHPLIDHDSPASSTFLRRLEDELDGAAYSIPHLRKDVGRADEHAA